MTTPQLKSNELTNHGETTNSKCDAPPMPTENVFRSLIRVYGLVGRIMHPYFARMGISGAQWGVLRALHRVEQEGAAGLRLTDLSNRLLIRPPSVTGTVDRLQRMGLVARDPSTTDLRVKRVSLTPAGRQLVEHAMEGHGTKVRALLSGLSSEEQAELGQLLERLGSHMEGMLEGAAPVEPAD